MIAGPQNADVRPMPRPKKRGTPSRLLVALVLSTLFHLSMVTVFRIVVFFPETQAKYCQVELISEVIPRAGESSPSWSLGGLHLGGSDLAQSMALQVSLPTLDFAELSRLRVGAGTNTGILGGSSGEPEDSWAKFARGLQSFGQSLRELAVPEEPQAPKEGPHPVAQHQPYEGFEGSIVWNSAPYDRELLLSPPIRALWNAADMAGVRWPVEIVIKVNSSGRVVNAFSPVADSSGLLEDIQTAMLKYRFAPLPAPQDDKLQKDQMATVVIKPAEAGQ